MKVVLQLSEGFEGLPDTASEVISGTSLPLRGLSCSPVQSRNEEEEERGRGEKGRNRTALLCPTPRR